MNLLKNPIIRLIGIIAILYFALFTNTHKKDSLGNRFSKENVKEDLGQIKEKGQHIITHVRKAQELKKSKVKPKDLDAIKGKKRANFRVKDIVIGDGHQVMCNNLATINYRIYFISSSNQKELEFIESYKFIVGDDKVDEIINRNIIGMKQGGLRKIILSTNYRTDNKKLSKYLSDNDNKNIIYEINLLNINSSSQEGKYSC